MFVIVDLAKKLEEQKSEAERQLKVLTRKLKVSLSVLKLRGFPLQNIVPVSSWS